MVSGGALLVFIIIIYCLVVISYTKPTKIVDENTNLVCSEEADDTEHPVDGQEWKIIVSMGVFTVFVSIICVLIHYPKTWSFWVVRLPLIISCTVPAIGILVFMKCKYILQQNKDQSFICPFVPFTPGLGLFLNVLLFSYLKESAHYMALMYIITGAVVYFSYGYFNSTLTVEKQELESHNEHEDSMANH